MCGDIGDPIYASEYLQIVEYIKTHNPKIHVFTITNGSYRKSEWWKQFAKISNEYDTINFSIDGHDDASNNLYRVGSNWSSIMDGINIMCDHSSAFVNWATIVFAFNQDYLGQIKQQAKDLGCDGLQLTYSTKFGSKYGQAYGGSSDPLEPRQEFISKTHRYERYFTNLTGREQSNQDYMNTNQRQFDKISAEYNKFITPMCAIGNRGIYVSADGIIHPCSWVSYPYESLHTDRKIIHFKDNFHQTNRDRLNLHTRSLNEILNDQVWEKMYNSFNSTSKAWVECEQKCHHTLVDKEYAVGWLTN
jgi:MoaA/NifB/PqqE/SkfB family radical SAM enzyme